MYSNIFFTGLTIKRKYAEIQTPENPEAPGRWIAEISLFFLNDEHFCWQLNQFRVRSARQQVTQL
jgi:hypothetical protein